MTYSKHLTAVDLCSGIGGFSLATLRQNIIPQFACELDPRAAAVYSRNLGLSAHDDLRHCARRVPAHDILITGLPCQPFSIIGHQQGRFC